MIFQISNQNIKILNTLQKMMQSSLKLTSFTPLGKQQFRKMKTIWQSLQDNNDSLQFRHAVDWQGMGLTDYPQIVKNPMDLSTINKKLRQQKYLCVQQVLDDMQLIWDNCKLYNQQGCWIYDLADKLQKSFKKMVKTFLPQIFLPGTMPKIPPLLPIKSEEEQVKYQDKIKFTDRLKSLRPEQLGIIVNKIKQVCPRAFKQIQGLKAQIVVDSIDSASFKTVSSLLETLQQPEDAVMKRQRI